PACLYRGPQNWIALRNALRVPVSVNRVLSRYANAGAAIVAERCLAGALVVHANGAEPSACPDRVQSVLFRPDANRCAFGRPEAQLINIGDIPALDLREQMQEVLLLLHQVLGAHLAGAADLAETDLLAIELITGEPVVTAGIAVSTVVAEGQRDGVAANHGFLTNPLGDVGGIVLQLLRVAGTAAYE